MGRNATKPERDDTGARELGVRSGTRLLADELADIGDAGKHGHEAVEQT